jgi:hypothetical protein
MQSKQHSGTQQTQWWKKVRRSSAALTLMAGLAGGTVANDCQIRFTDAAWQGVESYFLQVVSDSSAGIVAQIAGDSSDATTTP